MTNSKNKYIDEEKPHFNDCVEGDTVSEGDTSDEEDNNLEVPSGNADCFCPTRSKKRRSLYTAIAIAAVVVTGAGIGGGVYASRKNWGSASPSTVLDEEFAISSSIPAIPNTDDTAVVDDTENTHTKENTNATPLTEEIGNAPETENVDSIPSMTEDEDENDNMWNDDGIIDLNDSELMVEFEEDIQALEGPQSTQDENETMSTGEDISDENDSEPSVEIEEEIQVEEEPHPTQWPNLVGMTGEDAKAVLNLMYGVGTYDIIILHEHSLTTRDYRFNRIRIFTNDEGVVTQVPHIG